MQARQQIIQSAVGASAAISSVSSTGSSVFTAKLTPLSNAASCSLALRLRKFSYSAAVRSSVSFENLAAFGLMLAGR